MNKLLNDSEFILLLCKEIGWSWKSLGSNLFTGEAELNGICCSYPLNKFKEHEIAYQMLLSWKKAKSRTLDELKDALLKAGRIHLVNEINRISSKTLTVINIF